MVSVKDVIAPESIDVDFTYLKIGHTYLRTLFVAGYPRFVNANWLSPLVNFDHSLNISMFIYPVEGKSILDDLHRKITEMEAEIQSDVKQGKIPDVNTEIKLEDAKSLQQELAKGAERFFQFGLYVTIPADSLEELETITKEVQSTLGSLLIIAKVASLQMEDGLKTTLPTGNDKLVVTRNMDTTSLATTFPFTSSELTANEGILYGINEHNESLVIFDRFSLENANACVFAKSGAGKSYLVKLETLRSLMFGTEVLVIDPENEYQALASAVGGEYITFSFNSQAKINPFDLAHITEKDENQLGQKIISLHGLLKVMMGNLTPTEEALLDRALVASYKAKGITPDPATQGYEPPLLEDLYKTLIGMETPEAIGLSSRLEKYVKGSFRGIFDQRTNITLENQFTVFSVKELQDELRPIAMFIVLDYIWNRIRTDLRQRLLVVDEAWYLMKNPDTANFMYAIAKRARKYYLGLTTITQDVGDFLGTDHGKAIVTNSSIQILMKQSPAAIDEVAKVFYLSQGERHLLLAADIGEGLFFAGANHVAIRVVASPEEHQLITTKPQELLNQKPPIPPSPPPTQATAPSSNPPPLPPKPPPKPQFRVEEVNTSTIPSTNI
ncbi:MAG: ATP-binding protein [Candidatus Chisholmbacteria bacterium]|nr:ATP-binding protein [Candidatus Chisholmbacteria bacterium]